MEANSESKTDQPTTPPPEDEPKASKKKGKNFDPSQYQIMLFIGQGNFSSVYMVENIVTKILYAMKSFDRNKIERLKKERDVLMEKYTMEKITPCPYIIQYYGSAKDDFEMHILYEYINGGDLWSKCIIYGLPSEQQIKFYFLQLLKGIKHLHSFDICHRDIKPENVMITKDAKCVKIIDFGSSRDVNGTDFEAKIEEQNKKENKRKPNFKHFVGTPNYMAPECVHNQFSDKRGDYWSLGCVLYQLYTGFPPFLGASEYLIFKKSVDAKYIFPEGIVPQDAEDIIRRCLIIDANERITIDQMLAHNYFKDVINDEDFLKEVPKLNEDEIKFDNIRNELKKKYEKYREMSKNLEKIKDHERMQEDLKQHQIKPEPSVDDEDISKLLANKDKIQNEYEQGLATFKEEIASLKLGNEAENSKFNLKLKFLETQICHDIFNIVYRGFEEEGAESDNEGSQSGNSDGDNNNKNDKKVNKIAEAEKNIENNNK